MKKRILSILLCCVMLVGVLPTTAFAEEDTRTPITSVAAELTMQTPVYGDTVKWHSSATITSTTPAGSPAEIYQPSTVWMRLKGTDPTKYTDWEFYYNDKFIEGKYRYVIRLDNPNQNYVLDKSNPPTVTINGKQWDVTTITELIRTDGTKYQYSWVYSPDIIEVTNSTAAELFFTLERSFKIEATYVGDPVSLSVTEYAGGGRTPYTFSKVSGPEWLTVSADGKITGTAPSTPIVNSALVVRVTDAEGSSVDKTIPVGETKVHEEDRIPITAVTAELPIQTPVYGATVKWHSSATITSTTPAGSPAEIYQPSTVWMRLKGTDPTKYTDWEFYYSDQFIEGKYRYVVRLDNPNQNYVLDKSNPPTVTINGKQWDATIVTELINTDGTKYQYSWVYSPDIIEIKKPTQLSGSVTLPGAYYGSFVNPTLSGDVATLHNQGKLKFRWQYSWDGISGWSTIVGANTFAFSDTESYFGKYLRVVLTTDDENYTGSVISNAVKVEKAMINFAKPVAPSLHYDGTNVLVTNAVAGQEYKISDSSTLYSWDGSTVATSNGVLTLTGASANTTVYVHTRVAESKYKPAGKYTAFSSIYTGNNPESLADFALNYSTLTMKEGDIVQLTATPIPDNESVRSSWGGIFWYSNDTSSAKLYEDAACTDEYNRYTDGSKETVYIKALSQNNSFTVGGEKNISSYIPTVRQMNVTVTDTEGNYLLESLHVNDVTLAPGESTTVDISTYPDPAVVGTLSFEKQSGSPDSNLTLTPGFGNKTLTITVPADAIAGAYNYTIKVNRADTQTPSGFKVTVLADKEIPLDDISVIPSSVTLAPGGEMTLTVAKNPTNTTVTGSVEWSKLSGSDKISFDASGKVTVADDAPDGVTAVIRASLGGKTATCTVTVATTKYNVSVKNGVAYIDDTAISEAGKGQEIFLKANAAPAGKMFDQWKVISGDTTILDADSTLAFFFMPAEDVTIEATYKDAPATTYTVNFNSNGGTGSMAAVTGVSGTYKLPGCGFTAPAGKQFKGWATSATGTVISGTITVNADTTLYAIWEDISVTEYTVTFNGNGGTPSVGSMTTTNQKLASLPTATRSGSYSFDGWYTAAIGGTKVTTSYQFTADTTVYAHWTYTGGSSSGGGYTYYTIKATAGVNGAISPSGSVSVRSGKDQTFTITPDTGYAISDVKIDGKSVGAVKSYTFENVKGNHTIEAIFMKANGNPQTGVFVDVPEGSYYEEAVAWAVENGITKGASDTTFDPNGICTRAQAVTFLWRAAGSPTPKSSTMPFTDVKAGSYYYDAVLWAVENGITKGTSNTTFSPDVTCSRAQIVTFLWRSQETPAAGAVNPFTDVKADAYYAEAVLWAVKEDVTKGTTDTTFSPNADCTRAQIVTFIWRALAE